MNSKNRKMKGENTSVAFKLIGKLGGQKIYRSVEDKVARMGWGETFDIDILQRVTNFKYVDNAGNVTKTVKRIVNNGRSDLRKSTFTGMRKEGWNKRDVRDVITDSNVNESSYWSIRNLKNGKCTEYSIEPWSFHREIQQGSAKNGLYIGLNASKKNIQLAQYRVCDSKLPKLNIDNWYSGGKKLYTSVSDFIKEFCTLGFGKKID